MEQAEIYAAWKTIECRGVFPFENASRSNPNPWTRFAAAFDESVVQRRSP